MADMSPMSLHFLELLGIPRQSTVGFLTILESLHYCEVRLQITPSKVPCTIVQVFGPIFEQLKKFVKNLILIGISSNFLCNISTCICIRKNYKNGEFSPFHFRCNLARDHVL